MNLPFDFGYYLKEKIARKQSPNIPRAEFLIKETQKSFIGLKDRVEKLEINEFNANSVIKDIHDIIIEKIRAKMLLDGYNASGNFAHEAEVAYMKNLNFSDFEVSFVNELRQARNGITYYGKIYEKEYAKSCYDFLMQLNTRLDMLFKEKKIKIREIAASDKKEWIKLTKLSDNRNKEWAEQKFDNYLESKKKKRILVAEEDGKLIGFSGIKGEDLEENVSEMLNKNYVLVTWIAFIPEYRKKGLGSKILKECEKYAVRWEKRGIWLGCKDDVIPFYEKNGYKSKGTFINEKGKKENLMVKEIT